LRDKEELTRTLDQGGKEIRSVGAQTDRKIWREEGVETEKAALCTARDMVNTGGENKRKGQGQRDQRVG